MEKAFSFDIIKAIIGLGNPGAQYAHNRHSIGFRIVDELANRFGGQWQTNETMAYTTVRIGEHEVYLIKPLTFMNNSGRVVSWLQKKGITAEQIVVAHDELEKEFGTVLMRFAGSHKGHNGLKSLIGVMGADFWHLKFGISRPADRDAVPQYVLSNFTRDEEARVPELVDQAVASLTGGC
jgi:PTH1 family peptidyl-tRNA hydrolase